MHSELEKLGYSPFQELHRVESGINIGNVARVVSESRENYLLHADMGIFRATITGKLRHYAETRVDLPAVGDWVAISLANRENAVIESVFPRRTVMERSAVGRLDVQIIAANVDIAFVVVAADRDFSINRIDRYLTLILNGGIIPVVLINKCDLLVESDWRGLEEQVFRRHPAVEVIATSFVSGLGLSRLAEVMKPMQTCCFTGSSGVGKSSLINRFAGEQLLETSEVSDANNRGRHTTTGRHLHLLASGALLLDTPGMREVAMSDAEAGVGAVFVQIEEIAESCKFKDCSHSTEPGCALIAAVASATIDADTLASYLKLKAESARFEMKIADKRKAEKSFGKKAREIFKMKKLLKG